MIVAAKYQDAWAYILGPVTGGMLGALLYEKFLATAQVPGQVEAREAPVR
jgi:hypothetical protein